MEKKPGCHALYTCSISLLGFKLIVDFNLEYELIIVQQEPQIWLETKNHEFIMNLRLIYLQCSLYS